MKKTKREFIFITFITSGVGVILSLVALGTQNWISADVDLVGRLSYVQYGLFSGTYERVVSTTLYFELSMTCSFADNSCAMLCGSTIDGRYEDLQDLLIGRNFSFNTNCPRVIRTFVTYDTDLRVPGGFTRAGTDYPFLNAGVWISTILFLTISCVFGLISSGLAVWNTTANPIEIVFNVFGLYVYNGVAAFFILITVVLWGAEFGITLVKNICILETITGQATSDGYAVLGYSYWLTFVSFLLYICSIAILAVRQHLINLEPKAEIEDIDRNDAAIILY